MCYMGTHGFDFVRCRCDHAADDRLRSKPITGTDVLSVPKSFYADGMGRFAEALEPVAA